MDEIIDAWILNVDVCSFSEQSPSSIRIIDAEFYRQGGETEVRRI
jgi:hypothetical protein